MGGRGKKSRAGERAVDRKQLLAGREWQRDTGSIQPRDSEGESRGRDQVKQEKVCTVHLQGFPFLPALGELSTILNFISLYWYYSSISFT